MPWFAQQWYGVEWFEPGWFGGLSGPEVFEGIDVLSAIQSWWELTDITSGLSADQRLWHMMAPQGALLPYVTYFLVSEVAETWTTAYPFLRDAVQINCHAATDIEARSTALAIGDGLKGARLMVNGSNICHCLPTQMGMDIGHDLGPRGEDCWVAFVTFDICWTP